MTDGHDAWRMSPWPPPQHPPASRPHASGLFPGPPPRPTYREPHPVHAGPLLAGFGATVLWFALFGGLGNNLATYAWWTIGAALTAWIVACLLSLFGDRGVAAGVALASSLGLSIAMVFVGEHWITTYDWPLW